MDYGGEKDQYQAWHEEHSQWQNEDHWASSTQKWEDTRYEDQKWEDTRYQEGKAYKKQKGARSARDKWGSEAWDEMNEQANEQDIWGSLEDWIDPHGEWGQAEKYDSQREKTAGQSKKKENRLTKHPPPREHQDEVRPDRVKQRADDALTNRDDSSFAWSADADPWLKLIFRFKSFFD